MFSLLALLPLLPALTSACRPGDSPMPQRRNPGMADPEAFAAHLQKRSDERFHRRQQGGTAAEATGAPTYQNPATYTTWTQLSSDENPVDECQGYFYPPMTAIKSQFPPVWQTAYILDGDDEAMSAFQAINASLNEKFPNDLPRGTGHDGNWTGVAYNYTDPDCWWTWKQCTVPAASTGLPADITTVPEPNTWGLGFDDGPNCSHNALYDFLQEQKQTATMFLIGSNVADWPLQALRTLNDGHQIAVHTWSHQYMTSFSNENAFAELWYARKILQELLGIKPIWWRPPYGDVDNRIRYIAQQLNMSTIVWEYDTEDWKEGVPSDGVTAQDVTQNYQNIIQGATNGSYSEHGIVVLNHELTNFTMQEMVNQYPAIKSSFAHVMPICAALNNTHPYEETWITCPDFNSYIAGNIMVSNSTTNTDVTPGATTTYVAGGHTVTTTNGGSAATGSGSSTTGAGVAASTGKTSGASRVLSAGAAKVGAAVIGLSMGAMLL